MTSKGKKTKRLISLLIAAVMVACMVCAAVVPAGASEDDVRATADGIMHFGFFFNDVYMGSGSCFLINEDTIITANHCTGLSKLQYDYLNETKGWTRKEIDSGFSDGSKDKGFTYKVTLARDFTIDAKLVNSSENMDFAILKLSQPIKNRTCLALRDSTTVQAAETAYAVGFPSAKDSSTITYQYFNQKDIAFESGTINRKQYTETFTLADTGGVFSGDVLMLSAGTISAGNSGGPMVDTNGNVIGICCATNTSSGTCYASAISQVIEILDALGIYYKPASDETAPTTSDETTVTATEQPASSSEAQATEAPAKTDEGGLSMGLLIGIIAGAIVLIAAVIVIIVVLSKKKNNNNNGGGSTPPSAPVQRAQAPAPAPQAQQPYNRPPTPPQSIPTPPVSDGAGETSVLSDGAGETTVLGGSGATGFTLVRKSNNETININKPEFIIGKERRRVDYCISDNNSVSRTHAKIRVRSGKCYITDLGSTNCTFVNGVKLSPNQEVALVPGDKIKISDVEFEFNG